MTMQDFFYLTVSIGIWLFIITMVFLMWQMWSIFRDLREVASVAKNTALDLSLVRLGLKVNALKIARSFLNNVVKGGERYG